MAGCCVVFHKQLGDLLLLQPALSRLSGHFGAPVVVLTRGGHEPLLQLMAEAAFHSTTPQERFASLHAFDELNKTAFRSMLVRASEKICISALPDGRRWYQNLVFGRTFNPLLGDKYVAQFYWENVQTPAKKPFAPPQLSRPPANWRPDGIPEDFILLHPTSGWKSKRWRAGQWAELAKAVHSATGLPFVMSGGVEPWQIEHCQAIRRRAAETLVEPGRSTSLKEYIWLCANAKMVLTVDGSASHLAAAFGTKSLTLFGPTNVSNWHWHTDINRAVLAPLDDSGKPNLKLLMSDMLLPEALSLWAA